MKVFGVLVVVLGQGYKVVNNGTQLIAACEICGEDFTTCHLGPMKFCYKKCRSANAPDWKPRRWVWVDPEKDINAQIKSVDNHFKSRRQVISEAG